MTVLCWVEGLYRDVSKLWGIVLNSVICKTVISQSFGWLYSTQYCARPWYLKALGIVLNSVLCKTVISQSFEELYSTQYCARPSGSSLVGATCNDKWQIWVIWVHFTIWTKIRYPACTLQDHSSCHLQRKLDKITENEEESAPPWKHELESKISPKVAKLNIGLKCQFINVYLLVAEFCCCNV